MANYIPAKHEEDPWVMYIVVRSSLGMSAGKIAAQVGHAVGMVYENVMSIGGAKINAQQERLNHFQDWQNHGHRKVVLRADDQQFEKLKQETECFLVRDAGLTQVAVGSETCLALFPGKKNSFPKTIKRLQILK